MFEGLKNHFIPTQENQFQPHFLRMRVALGILLLVVVLESTYLFATTIVLPRSTQFAAIFAAVLVDQTNAQREADNLRGLTVNTKLEYAAKLKAEDMANKGYFAHNTPDGKTPWYWFGVAGYDYAAAGENLAVNFTDSKDVTDAWMRSPGHRANIMNGNYTEIGIATAEGTYKGKPAIFVVQEFGRPSLIAREIEEASSTVASLTAMITENGTLEKPSTLPSHPVSRPVEKVTPVPTSTLPTHEEVVPAKAVAGAETAKLNVADNEVQPLLTEPSPVNKVSRVGKVDLLLASPRNTTTMIYLILGAILTLALGLTIFIKIRVQHPHIIANGILLVAILVSLIMLNAVLGATGGVI